MRARPSLSGSTEPVPTSWGARLRRESGLPAPRGPRRLNICWIDGCQVSSFRASSTLEMICAISIAEWPGSDGVWVPFQPSHQAWATGLSVSVPRKRWLMAICKLVRGGADTESESSTSHGEMSIALGGLRASASSSLQSSVDLLLSHCSSATRSAGDTQPSTPERSTGIRSARIVILSPAGLRVVVDLGRVSIEVKPSARRRGRSRWYASSPVRRACKLRVSCSVRLSLASRDRRWRRMCRVPLDQLRVFFATLASAAGGGPTEAEAGCQARSKAGMDFAAGQFLVRASRTVGALGLPLGGERRSTNGRPSLPSRGSAPSSALWPARPCPLPSSLSGAMSLVGRMRMPGGSRDMLEHRSWAGS